MAIPRRIGTPNGEHAPLDQRSTLDIRSRDLPYQSSSYILNDWLALGQKRKSDVIDLTDGNDDSSLRESSIPSSPARKKSRSSSNSRDSQLVTEEEELPSFPTSAINGCKFNGVFRSRLDGRKGKIQVASAVKVPPKPRAQPTPAEQAKRDQFLRNINTLWGVRLNNEIDNDTPPIDFKFVKESVLGNGVFRATEDVMLGCGCQKKYKQQYGCVYLDYCSCIEDSAEDNNGKKCFPYGASENNYRCLRQKVLNTRNHIYECNSRCDCTRKCKNRVVQHGRQVQVEIFKTTNRGWGLRCLEDLQKGQFVDSYRGEIITSDEANQRGTNMTADEENFLFDFDKFKDTEVYDPERAYVCDGRYMGSPTRFINHSCDPNCRLFTVSYNHSDRNIYELAFFAVDDIPKGTELTFDYYDEEEETFISDEMAKDFEKEKGYRPTKCLCGKLNCRQYFFH